MTKWNSVGVRCCRVIVVLVRLVRCQSRRANGHPRTVAVPSLLAAYQQCTGRHRTRQACAAVAAAAAVMLQWRVKDQQEREQQYQQHQLQQPTNWKLCPRWNDRERVSVWRHCHRLRVPPFLHSPTIPLSLTLYVRYRPPQHRHNTHAHIGSAYLHCCSKPARGY